MAKLKEDLSPCQPLDLTTTLPDHQPRRMLILGNEEKGCGERREMTCCTYLGPRATEVNTGSFSI